MLVKYHVSFIVFVIWVLNPFQSLLEGQEAENAQNVEQTDEVNAVVLEEPSNSLAKNMSVRQSVPMVDEIVASRVEEKD